MKRLILTLFASAAVISQAVAQNAYDEAVETVEAIDSVVVEYHQSHQGMVEQPISSDGHWAFVSGGLNFGFVAPLDQQAPMDVATFHSWEISWMQILGVSYSPLCNKSYFALGVGMNWRNWRMTTPDVCFNAVDDGTVLEPYPSDAVKHDFSRIKTTAITLSLLWHQQLGDSKCSFTFGPVLNFNVHASALTAWNEADGNRYERSCDKIGQRKFTVDAFAAFNPTSKLGLYVRYSPMNILKKGPEFKAISFGVTIGI